MNVYRIWLLSKKIIDPETAAMFRLRFIVLSLFIVICCRTAVHFAYGLDSLVNTIGGGIDRTLKMTIVKGQNRTLETIARDIKKMWEVEWVELGKDAHERTVLVAKLKDYRLKNQAISNLPAYLEGVAYHVNRIDDKREMIQKVKHTGALAGLVGAVSFGAVFAASVQTFFQVLLPTSTALSNLGYTPVQIRLIYSMRLLLYFVVGALLAWMVPLRFIDSAFIQMVYGGL